MTLFEAPLPAPAGPLVRVKLVVAYDGSGFRGVAPQPGVPTVGGALGEVIGRVLRHQVVLTVAGRTDAGVHAWGQVVTFDVARSAFDVVGAEGLQRSVNKLLGPRVVVRSAGLAPAGFDARHSACARRYRYTVLNRPLPDPFLAATSWHVEQPLDLGALRLACDPLHGEHDFASFCRRPPDGGSLVRRIHDARWYDVGGGRLRFEVQGSSFCQQMVRALVGTMVQMGLGRRRAGEMAGILRARDRAAAGPLAPPHGLCLREVLYPQDDLGAPPTPGAPGTPRPEPVAEPSLLP